MDCEINTGLWGKKNESNGIAYWLPLEQHFIDTKNVAGFLWDHWLAQSQRDLIINSIKNGTEEKARNLCLFLACVHDIGKATPAFQIKESRGHYPDLDNELLEKLERKGFRGISSLKLENPSETPHNLAGQALLESYGVPEDLAVIIGGHHGKPIDSDKKKKFPNDKAYEANYYQVELSNSDKDKNTQSLQERQKIQGKWKDIQRQLFNFALKQSHFDSVSDLPSLANQSSQVLLEGLVIMSDWLASNEEFFPLLPLNESTIQDQDFRFQNGISKWYKTNSWLPSHNINFGELYKKRFGFTPRKPQEIMSETIEKTIEPGIIIFEAPMGSGKTEAALIAAEQLAYKTHCNGIFFGLPTQATSNGIFSRVEDWLNKISVEDNERKQLRLSHGKAYLNKEFTSLASGIAIDEEDFNEKGLSDSGIIVNQWFSGRKTSSLDDFVVGTVDQLLMMALKQRHLALRHLGFSKKVVIIDEVHAYDAYMSVYLERALGWLASYSVPVILLSATLPSKKRYELINSYMKGKGVHWAPDKRKEIKKQISTDTYPLITYNDGNKIFQEKDFPSVSGKNVKIEKLNETENEVEVEEVADKVISCGAVLGIIVNTVKRAQELMQNLSRKYGEEKVSLLHSAFISTQRIEKENELKNEIGKGAKRPRGKIIIGTQVIEQSLDIDFDVMISDLAPMDLLLQRMGRLHRHEVDNRPPEYSDPQFYVLGCSDTFEFDKGSQYVYGGYLLARTQYYLPQMINLPNDISPLVQEVYDFSNESDEKIENKLPEDIRNRYLGFKKEEDEKRKEKEKSAGAYRLRGPNESEEMLNNNPTLIGLLTHQLPQDSEEKANAQVRDIEERIEVIALQKINEGYGIFGTQEDISGKLEDPNMCRKIAQNTLVLPALLSKNYNIDRTIKFLENYNLKHLRKFQDSIWLKGTLGIIFDEDGNFEMENGILHYDISYGVTFTKKSIDR